MSRIIEVDTNDNQIGKIEKLKAHTTPILHRAFSVFLYNENKMLIQKRAINKYHSGGLWANTCCSHPTSNNTKQNAIERLKEEANIDCKNIKELFSFTYFNKFNDNLFEYEIDHVFVGKYNGEYKENKDEVAELKWIDIDELALDLTKNPDKYCCWFKLCAPKVIEHIKQK